MNILFVHAIGKTKFGGGEKWVIMAACGLRDKGHSVWVGGRPGSLLLETAQAHRLNTVRLNVLSDISPYHVWKIARVIKKRKIDVVISRERELCVTGLAARLARRPVVLARHGLPLRASIKKHVFLLNRLADGIITNARSTKETYEQNGYFPGGFTRLIYNGIAAPCDGSPYPFEKEFPGKKIILSIGRLATQKGFCHLIEAMTLLRDTHPDAQLVILGEGKLRRRLERLAQRLGVSDNVHLHGFVPDVSPFLQSCDLFVLPSLYEGMPNAAMEAMVHAKPVIITQVDGAEELIPNNTIGTLIPPKNPEAIAEAVSSCLKDPSLRESTGQKAREHALTHFSEETMIEELECYLQEKAERR